VRHELSEGSTSVNISRDSVNARGERTRVKIIVTAEKLFAEFGIDGVATRVIALESGQHNKMAVEYHFSDRVGLVRAIFVYREVALSEIRRKLYVEARRMHTLRSVRSLMRILYEPIFIHYRDNDGISYVKLMMHYLSTYRQKGLLHPVEELPFTRIFRIAYGRLRDTAGFVDNRLYLRRMGAVGALFLSAIIQHSARGVGFRDESPDEFFEDTIEMMVGALLAKY